MTIKQKQNLLQYLGYYTGTVDGVWGKASQNATREFQREFGGLTVDGICGADTEKALKHAVAYGMTEKKTEDKATGSFWDSIKHFARKEFECPCGKCGGFPVEMNEKLIRIADLVRDYFDAPAYVSSGVRCKEHNANVGGVSNSRHLTGKAMDFCIDGKNASQVLEYVQSRPDVRYAYEIDNLFVHMDIM